ncbi:MAG TPA: SMP-30/gluconolactonase/LRE family protein [Acidimicrobiales bacterium]
MTSGSAGATTILDQLAFPKCARWHDGRLWFSDAHDGRVWAMSESGQAEPVVSVEGRPGGIDWLPDGRLLVVSERGRALLRLDGATLTTVCDLSRFSPHPWNDLVVDRDGRAYVGGFGHDVEAGDEPAGGPMVCVEPDGEAWVVIDRLLFPNGAIVVDTADGRALVVSETYGQRLSAYDVLPDGSAARPRLWADLRPNFPSSVTLDADGAVWVADPVLKGLMRVKPGIGTVGWISTGDRGAFSCALGGSDGRTLYVCTSGTSNPTRTVRDRSGRIEAVRVDVPAALPSP